MITYTEVREHFVYKDGHLYRNDKRAGTLRTDGYTQIGYNYNHYLSICNQAWSDQGGVPFQKLERD